MSSEYGWDDEYIKNLTVRRTRQVMAAIAKRKRDDLRIARSHIEWQTKQLSMMTAMTSMADEDGRKSLMKVVEDMSMTPKSDTSRPGPAPDEPAGNNPDSGWGEIDLSYLEDDEGAIQRAAEKNGVNPNIVKFAGMAQTGGNAWH